HRRSPSASHCPGGPAAAVWEAKRERRLGITAVIARSSPPSPPLRHLVGLTPASPHPPSRFRLREQRLGRDEHECLGPVGPLAFSPPLDCYSALRLLVPSTRCALRLLQFSVLRLRFQPATL